MTTPPTVLLYCSECMHTGKGDWRWDQIKHERPEAVKDPWLRSQRSLHGAEPAVSKITEMMSANTRQQKKASNNSPRDMPATPIVLAIFNSEHFSLVGQRLS